MTSPPIPPGPVEPLSPTVADNLPPEAAPLELAPPGLRFPTIGEMLGEFRLLAELGRGGMGRVYLAEQAYLGGRLMILKVSPRGGQEHLNLARLQHTHIVPLYAVHDFPARNLRNLCMPCLGGATLQQLLRPLRSVPPERRCGQDVLKALQAAVADPRLFWDTPGPNRRFLERASYVQAVCWIGVCLADALHYAHEQGLVHLDVKPSNALLTADCQPMLLDFHLASEPIRPEGYQPQWLGGTPAYMSPEQRTAWRACREQHPIGVAVDARSDVYSLGLLIRELLYGYDPDAETDWANLALPGRADLSAGLREVLARCLHPDPAPRYPSAALLAEDLRRHLTNRLLIGVRNRSLVERWRKWRQRRPHALLLSILIALCAGTCLAFGGLYAVQTSERLYDAEQALVLGQQQMLQHRFGEAVGTFDRALEQLGNGPGGGALHAELLRWRRRAARAHDVLELHEQVERSRYLHGDDLLAPAMLRALEVQCRTAWQERDRLLTSGAEPLDGDLEEDLRHDLLDVAILWADCLVRLTTAAEADTVRRQALQVLDEAESLFGPSPVLNRQRAVLAQALGQAAAPGGAGAGPAPRTAWEHYTLGRWLLRGGDLAGAAVAFDHAVELRPQDFWPWFGKGLCAHQRHCPAEAVLAFSVCIALAPDRAACYYNRAQALAAHGDFAAALRDFDRALQLDPRLAAAALGRGALHLQQRDLAKAEVDFQLALTLGANPAAVHYNQALVHQARQEFAAALARLESALQHDPNHSASRALHFLLQKQLGPSSQKPR
jgi:serine/threonine protein kinase/tetratricopeptide (TPR) repeat protein